LSKLAESLTFFSRMGNQGPTVRREQGESYSDESEQLEHTEDDEENHPAITPGRKGTLPDDPSFCHISHFHSSSSLMACARV
jgi:hypothetical protein